MSKKQQRVQQSTDPVFIQVRKKVQQFRENPSENKMHQISHAVALGKESVQWEAVIHELLNLFNETYDEDEFNSNIGFAFYISEILYGLIVHKEVDIPTILVKSVESFPNKKQQIQKNLVKPIMKEWKENGFLY
jgi:hypothetical protein